MTQFMAKCARTNKDSFVWDKAMGSAGFLVSAMDIMIKDARETIANPDLLEAKIKQIKENQLLGIEILGNIYILAVLNMILMGDGSSTVVQGDSHDFFLSKDFPATVFLLNPPYSAPGKGFNFVEEAFSQMTHGYGAILIQDSAGNGQGMPYTERILKNNTLEASIKMPTGLFGNKASVSVYIFVFRVGRPHEEDDLVTFIDMSEDGYSRLNRNINQYLYVVSALGHLTNVYGYGNQFRLNSVKNTHIQLTLKSGTDVNNYTEADIDWDYMEATIRAMEKQVIASVVDYKDAVIAATKKLSLNSDKNNK